MAAVAVSEDWGVAWFVLAGAPQAESDNAKAMMGRPSVRNDVFKMSSPGLVLREGGNSAPPHEI
ncbi:hypothetical protein GCM10007170_34470 [Arthrobacter liuii]|uniref:Uncharacterized protein n=1 Tax=Arthrobacter liuii TaxID=1476996 RepID=A0ABQ2AYF9_9MICC|nr:hypothetical protein GCM10007170_34470 [Arthrobacter liuii]